MPGQEFSADKLVVGNTYRVQSYKRHDGRPDELMTEGNYELTNKDDRFFKFTRKKYDPKNPHLMQVDIPQRTDPHNPKQIFYWRFFETAEDIENRGCMRAALHQKSKLGPLESKLLSEKYFGDSPYFGVSPGPPGGGRKYTHRRTKIRRKNKTKTKKTKTKTTKTKTKTRMKYRRTRRIR